MPWYLAGSLKGGPGAAGEPGAEGPQGLQGPMGTQGIGIRFIRAVETEAALPSSANQGDLYVVLNPEPAQGYVWDEGEFPELPSWRRSGPVQGPQGIQGIQGPAGPTAVSNDAANASTIGSDGLIFTPPGSAPYTLPIATATLLGGLRVGTYTSGQSVNGVAADGTLLWGTASALGAPLRLPPVSMASFNGTDAYWYQDTANNVRLVTTSGNTGTFIAADGRQTFNRVPLCSTAPTENNHLANKQYVDSQTNGFLRLAGGTMTGAITLPATVQSLVWGSTTYNVFGGTGGVAIRHGTNNIVTYTSTAATFVQQIIASATAGITFGTSTGPGFSRGSTTTKIAAKGMIELPTTAPTAADAVRKDYVDARVVMTLAGAAAPSRTGLSEGSIWVEYA